MTQSIDKMEDQLKSIGFFVGGLTDEGIKHYYYKMIDEGKLS